MLVASRGDGGATRCGRTTTRSPRPTPSDSATAPTSYCSTTELPHFGTAPPDAVYRVPVPGDVQIRQLEYLVALAHERHFGRAAAACHASQPALSAALRKLEQSLGVTIILRGRRFAGFTPEGTRVVGWAHRILAERDALRTDLGRMRQGLTATLRIGAIPTAVPATALLTDAFTAAHPHARIRIETLSSREIGRRLAEFDLDAGLTYLDGRSRAAVELYRERYVLLTPTDGPLGDRASVGWAEAEALPLCTLTSSMQNRRILDEAMLAAGAQLTPVVETDTVAAIYGHLANGHRSTIIAHTWLHTLGVPTGLRAIPLPEVRPSPAIGLVTAEQQPIPIVAEALLDAVRELDVAAVLDRSADEVLSRFEAPSATPR
jgi:DNA-binding transcriptional LysR family regulator